MHWENVSLESSPKISGDIVGDREGTWFLVERLDGVFAAQRVGVTIMNGLSEIPRHGELTEALKANLKTDPASPGVIEVAEGVRLHVEELGGVHRSIPGPVTMFELVPPYTDRAPAEAEAASLSSSQTM